MSQVGGPSDILGTVMQQIAELSKLAPQTADLTSASKTLRAAYLQAGLTILQGYTSVVQAAIDNLAAEAKPQPASKKVKVE